MKEDKAGRVRFIMFVLFCSLLVYRMLEDHTKWEAFESVRLSYPVRIERA